MQFLLFLLKLTNYFFSLGYQQNVILAKLLKNNAIIF
jgi:hypothetical protein